MYRARDVHSPLEGYTSGVESIGQEIEIAESLCVCLGPCVCLQEEKVNEAIYLAEIARDAGAWLPRRMFAQS